MARFVPSRRSRHRCSVQAAGARAARALNRAFAPEALEARRLLAFALNVNFQPAGATTPAGYLADTGAVFADRGNGFSYGWNLDAGGATRDRNSSASPDQRYDTLVHTQQYGNRTWEVALPNGTYTVRVVGGDPSFGDSTIAVNAEGVLVASGTTTSSNHFVDGSASVTISDGRLTLSNAAAAINNKLCFVDITESDGEVPAGIPSAPGTIQAEDFDGGGKNVSYFDTTAGNQGGAYRSTDVDIQSTSDTGGGFAVGHIRPTEWLKYTVNITADGTYTLDTRVASASSGGVFHLEVDGADKTGPITLPNTGGWSTWKTLSKSGLSLIKGQHTLRLVFDQANSTADIGNVNWLKLSSGGTTLPVVSISATDSTAAEGGSNTGKFTVSRTGSTASALTLNYTIAGTATNGSDYNTLSGAVTLAAGASSATITINPIDDPSDEGSETVKLTLLNGSGFTLGTSSATVTIADNDAVTPPPGDVNWPTQWTKGPNIPKPRWESTSVAMDGKVWVFGGWISAASVGTQQVDVFDVASKTWSTLKNYAPIPHTHAAAATDPANHTIYFVGGLFGGYPGTPTNRVWKFNTQTLAWSELPSMPENHSSGGAALVNGELHYIGGVEDDRETNTGKHIFLDLSNMAAGWQTAPSMPSPRDHFGTKVLDGKIYTIGGEFGHDKGHDQQTLVHRYDPVTKQWQQLADMPIAKSHFESATFIWNGKIVVAGGQADNYKSTDNVSMYDPATNKWSILGVLPVAVQGPVVQLVGNTLVINGGSMTQGPIGDTWYAQLS